MFLLKENSLSASISLGMTGVLFVLTPLLVIPLTENFIVDSKWLVINSITFLLALIYCGTVFFSKKNTFVYSAVFVPILALLASVILSSFLTMPYPVEHLVGWGGIFISLMLLVLFLPSLLPKKTENVPVLLLGVIASLLLVMAGLQRVGFGPAQVINSLAESDLPTSLLFNVTGSSFIAFQITLLSVLSLGTQILIKKAQPLTYALLGLSVLGLILFGSTLLPGKPTTPLLPSYVTSWSVALDAMKVPKNALLGLGPESYQNAYTLYRPIWTNAEQTWPLRFTQAANTPLTILTTLGIIGLTAWVWFVIKVLVELKSEDNKKLLPLKTLIVTSFILQILFPLNIVLFTLQLLSIAFFFANKTQKPSILSSLDQVGLPLQQSNSSKDTLTKAIFVVLLILCCGISYLVIRHYVSQVTAYQADQNQKANEGVATYQQRQKAIKLNPYLDSHRRTYAQTNLLLAAALAEKTDKTDLEQQQVAQLLQQAIREARAATTIDPLDSRNWSVLATVYRNMIGAVEQADQWAIQAYVQAIKTNPTSPQLRVELGNIFLAAEQYPQALTFFSQAIELKPDYAQAYLKVAQTYEAANQLNQAREGYRQLLARLNENSDEYIQINQKIEELEKTIENQKPKANPAENAVSEQKTTAEQTLLEQEIENPVTPQIPTDPAKDIELSVSDVNNEDETGNATPIPETTEILSE